MNLPNQLQVNAAGRHVLTFAMGAVSALATFHIIDAGDATTIGNSISQISGGVAQIAAGLAPLIAIASGFYASWSASHKSQVAAVTAAVADGSIPKATLVNKIQATPVIPAPVR